ncbi:CCR4-NOT transcription complex subunit 6-like-A [Stylophora pistillata]|uniref:CCR4-NOT transcription complex subunit 6-like-A n=1 Tax=Stylophora pistillata TaxID=50429 RepID=UPI000C03D9AA|nr:CCR4-NOT transcription complex subunit 6-like-A [Stylophora pistillata]
MEDPHEWNKIILKALETVSKKDLDSLDLKFSGIQNVPRGLGELNLSHLKYFYLQGNNLSFLPDEFFPCLKNLVWLDLRDNKLHEIPQNIGEHRNIKTLLLGRNQLKHLPLELGVIKTLTGLNLSNNPLEEPPQTVVERGVYAIKHYLLTKLGVNPGYFQCDANESEYQSTESGSDSSHTDNKEKKNNCTDKLLMADGGSHDNGNQGSTKVVCPREAMSYYGALLGNIPKSYIIKPWKTGVFFKKEQMVDLSLENCDKDDIEEQ